MISTTTPHLLPEPLWTDKEFAAVAKISPSTPAQWRYTGKFKEELPFIKIGRSVRIDPDVARAFLKNGTDTKKD